MQYPSSLHCSLQKEPKQRGDLATLLVGLLILTLHLYLLSLPHYRAINSAPVQTKCPLSTFVAGLEEPLKPINSTRKIPSHSHDCHMTCMHNDPISECTPTILSHRLHKTYCKYVPRCRALFYCIMCTVVRARATTFMNSYKLRHPIIMILSTSMNIGIFRCPGCRGPLVAHGHSL